MNNSELGNETRHLGWERCYLSRLPVQTLFWWSSSLGIVCGHCLETSNLHLLLKSISTMLREITRPIRNNATDSAMEIWAPEAGIMWLKAWLSRRWLCFQTSFMLQGKEVARLYVCLTFLQFCYLKAPFPRLLFCYSTLNQRFIQLQHDRLYRIVFIKWPPENDVEPETYANINRAEPSILWEEVRGTQKSAQRCRVWFLSAVSAFGSCCGSTKSKKKGLGKVWLVGMQSAFRPRAIRLQCQHFKTLSRG